MMLTTLILALATGAGGTTPEVVDSILRKYDLGAHGGLVTHVNAAELFPGSVQPDLDIEVDAAVRCFEIDTIEEVLRRYLDEELEYEGRHYHIDDRGKLTLFAPASVHNRTQRILTALSTASGIQGTLQVDILNTPPGKTPLPAGVIRLADLDKALESSPDQVAESYQLALRVNTSSLIQATRSHELIAEYDVEVAENAISFDPVVIQMQSGTRMQVKASPSQAGCDLALIYWNGTPTGPVQDLQVNLEGRVHLAGSPNWGTGPDVLQRLSIIQHTMALNTAIPEGCALVLALQTSHGDGAQRVVLRMDDGMLPPVQSSELGNGQSLHMVRRSALSTVRVEAHVSESWSALIANNDTFRNRLNRGSRWELPLQFSEDGAGLGAELLESALIDSDWQESGGWYINSETQPRATDAAEAVKSFVDDLQGANGLVRVRLRLVQGPEEQEVLSCDLPLRLGAQSAVALGVESTGIFDFDTEIANGSALGDPSAGLDLDGALLFLHPTQTSDGRFQLRVRCHAQILQDTDVVGSSDRSFDQLQLKEYAKLGIDQWIEFTEHSPGEVVLGNRSAHRGPNDLALRVTFGSAEVQEFGINMPVRER